VRYLPKWSIPSTAFPKYVLHFWSKDGGLQESVNAEAWTQNTADEGKNMMGPWRRLISVTVQMAGSRPLRLLCHHRAWGREGFYRFPHAQLSGLPMSADLAK